eukprot:c17239_g1_i1.p1 GENE.c17239_g1_i1~~c17239_g1_i1.p1  ORF type:complete len:146 (-),score=78.13 c17239_g1_i1:306-743(-)
MSTPVIPKIDTNSLFDPVAAFVPEMGDDGDVVTELPGGLNRTIVPSPRGGFYANKSDLDWALSQDPIAQAMLQEKTDEQKTKHEDLNNQFEQLIGKRGTHEPLSGRALMKDKIDGINQKGTTTPGRTPRRDRAYDSLLSPRKVPN